MSKTWHPLYAGGVFACDIKVVFNRAAGAPIERSIRAKLDTGTVYTLLPGRLLDPGQYEPGKRMKVEFGIRHSPPIELVAIGLVQIEFPGGGLINRILFFADFEVPGFGNLDSIPVAFCGELLSKVPGKLGTVLLGTRLMIDQPQGSGKLLLRNRGICFGPQGYSPGLCPSTYP